MSKVAIHSLHNKRKSLHPPGFLHSWLYCNQDCSKLSSRKSHPPMKKVARKDTHLNCLALLMMLLRHYHRKRHKYSFSLLRRQVYRIPMERMDFQKLSTWRLFVRMQPKLGWMLMSLRWKEFRWLRLLQCQYSPPRVHRLPSQFP